VRELLDVTTGDQTGPASGTDGRIDPSVVAALYLEHADELRAFLTGVLRNGDLAGEVLQATFTRAIEAGHTAREETLKGWLFRVALNEALAVKRRQKVHDRSLREIAAGNLSKVRSDSPVENVLRWETVERIRAALEDLPAEQRQVVRMRMYEEKTFAEIAQETGLPLGTVLTRMRLALRRLVAALGRLDEAER
jgi:RNA polymerase sigma factor (sigma-70 family)